MNIIYTIPFTYLVIWGETFTSSNPSKGKRHCTHAPVDEVVNDPYGVLITYTLEIIAVSTGEDLDTNHVLYGLVGTF